MKDGLERSQMLVICRSGDVWHMFIFNGIKGQSLSHIYGEVHNLLVILRATRVGSSTILKPRKL
jgi:hypothetical protein